LIVQTFPDTVVKIIVFQTKGSLCSDFVTESLRSLVCEACVRSAFTCGTATKKARDY
jgi:hypothetical protein